MSQQTATVQTSPQTQEVIDLIQAVIGGTKGAWEQLVAKLEERRHEMDAASDRFFNTVEKESAEFKAYFKGEIDQIEAQFAAYHAALDKVAGFEKSKRLEDLSEGAKGLQESSIHFRRAMSVYEQKYLSNGPCKFPIVNLFGNVCKGVADKKIAIEALRATCHQYKIFYEEAIAEIDRSPHKDKPHVPQRREALAKIVGAIEAIDKMDPADYESKVREQLDLLAQGHEELDAEVLAYNEDKMGAGPTKSSSANWVINLTRAVLAGQMAPSALKPAANEYLERVRKTIDELQAAAKLPSESTTLLEEMPKMLESMEWMEDALGTLLSFADDPKYDRTIVAEALEDLTVGTERLVAAKEAIDHHNKTYGKVVCPHCQHYNPPSMRACESCQRQLPQLTGSDLYGDWGGGQVSSMQVLEGAGLSNTRDQVMTERMKQLFDACESFRKGRMELDALVQMLDENLEIVGKAQANLGKLKPPTVPADATAEEKEKCLEFIAVAEDALELLLVGTEECELGISKMRQGALDDDHGEIMEGQKLFYEGTQKLWQVKRVDDMLQNYIHPPEETPAGEGSETVDLSDA